MDLPARHRPRGRRCRTRWPSECCCSCSASAHGLRGRGRRRTSRRRRVSRGRRRHHREPRQRVSAFSTTSAMSSHGASCERQQHRVTLGRAAYEDVVAVDEPCSGHAQHHAVGRGMRRPAGNVEYVRVGGDAAALGQWFTTETIARGARFERGCTRWTGRPWRAKWRSMPLSETTISSRCCRPCFA